MNQSTVSYGLDALRKRLGDPLFVRSGQGVEPTARARALLPAAREALRNLEALTESEVYDPATDDGTLRISATALVRDLVMAPLLQVALGLAPKLNFELSSRGSVFEVFDLLRDGSLDLALLPTSSEIAGGLRSRVALQFRDAIYFDPNYPLLE